MIYGEKRREIGKISSRLRKWKKIRTVDAEVYPDDMHMLLEIPPKI